MHLLSSQQQNLLYSFIQGKRLGLLPTIAIILITGIGGAYLAKRQGMKAWNELRRRMATMETPGDALIDSVCIFFGGILLIMPGFITDIIGFLITFQRTKKYNSTIYSKMDL